MVTVESILGNRKRYKILKSYGIESSPIKVNFAGNIETKIYGTLVCSIGKKMLKRNRVFFESIEDAEACGYRPCSHCKPQ